MHKKLLNEATFALVIRAEGPLLVKSGAETWDPTVPDMQFVRTRHSRLGETVFIPGSSLKGTIRSYSEKIARTLEVKCCNPFDDDDSCGKRLDKLPKKNDSTAIYRGSCVACKLYGSTSMAGRAAFADAYPVSDVSSHLTKRTAVAIDRILGSVAVGPFDFEALVSGDFETTIRLRNFELWQLGLLGLTLRDFCLGRVRVGYGKSRGFGSVSAKLEKLELRAIAAGGLLKQDGTLSVKGIGALLGESREDYGIGAPEVEPVGIPVTASLLGDLLGSAIVFERPVDSETWCATEAESLFAACVQSAWTSYAAANPARGDRNG